MMNDIKIHYDRFLWSVYFDKGPVLKVVWHPCKTFWVLKRKVIVMWNYSLHFMMANYDIVEFTAIMQYYLIDKKKGDLAQVLLANKELTRKSGLHFCFYFLNWKVLSSKTFTVFF